MRNHKAARNVPREHARAKPRSTPVKTTNSNIEPKACRVHGLVSRCGAKKDPNIMAACPTNEASSPANEAGSPPEEASLAEKARFAMLLDSETTVSP